MQAKASEKVRTPSMSGLLPNNDSKVTPEPPIEQLENRSAIQKALAQRFMVDPAKRSQKCMESIQVSNLKEQARTDNEVSLIRKMGSQMNIQVKEAVFQYNNRPLVYEHKSLGFFGQESKFRAKIAETVMNPIYKIAYIVLVIAYSTVLAFEKNIKSKETQDELHYFLLAMNFCFLFDTVSKMILMGLYQHKNSYLRDIFQALDAFIVIIGQVMFYFNSFMKFIVYFSKSEMGLQAINIIITLRCAGLIQANQTSKRLTVTLLKAMPDLMIAITFLWFVFLIYAIMGLYLFSDSQYGRCRLTEKPVNATFWPINSADWCGTGSLVCPEGTVCGHGYKYGMTLEDDNFKNDGSINFDLTNYNNVGMALLTTYQAMTFDSWTLHMYGHMRSANRLVSGVFFVSLLAIGHFYLYSLVSAVVIAVFQKKSSISVHSKEEIMMLIKYQIAKYFQRKDPNVGSVNEENGTQENNYKTLTNHKDQVLSNRSTVQNIGTNFENEQQNVKTNLMAIDQELDLKNSNKNPYQRELASQLKGVKNKTSFQLKKNFARPQLQGSQGSQDKNVMKDQKNNHWNQEEVKLENKQTNHFISESNQDGGEAKLGINQFEDENPNLVEIKGIDRPIVSLSKQKSDKLRSIPGSKNASRKVAQEPLKPEKPKFDKLVGNFLKNQTMEEKMAAIREKEDQRFMEVRSKKNCVFNLFQKLATSNKFNFLVQAFVMANILLLCLDRYPLTLAEGRDHDIASMVFSIFFLLELLIKIIGMSPKIYFRDTIHWFDSLIVLISIFDVSFFFVPWIDQRKMKPLRTIRMFRLFKLLGSWKSIGQILATIGKIIIDIGPFSIIMVVFFYVASLIGMNIFFEKVRLNGSGIPNETEGGFVDSNFNNLFEGSLVIYILFQNDGWSTMYFQHLKATGMTYTCSTFFIMTLLFAQLVILNLFLTILLENFERDSQANAKKEEEDEDSDQKIKKFQEKQNKLQEVIENQMDPNDMHDMRMERFQAKFKNKGKVIAISNELAKKYLFGKSLFLFSVQNPVRKFCHKLIYHPWFEKLVVVVISAANFAMCFENPLLGENSPRQFILGILTFFFAAFFTIEAILKIFVQGFAFNGHFSYTKSYVNMIDLLVAVLSLIQLGLGHKGRVILLFRILRVPRPLQMASSGEGLKIALESLVMSMKVIGKAITVTFLFFLIFAIIFVNLLKGKLYKCTDSLGGFAVYEHAYQCYNYGGFWEAYMWNYDSVPKALINLFNSAITVGYAEMMYWGAKSTKVGGTVEPFEKTNYGFAVLSIIFMLTCSILILSVFVGMIVSAFNREEERISKRSLLSEFQIQWVRLLAEMMKIMPIRRIDSDSRLRVWLAEVLESRGFLNFIAVMIFLHSVILALKQFDQEEVFARVVEGLDHAFTILFVVECLLKLAVLRTHYFHAPWSYLDLFMAALGLTNIINAFIYKDVEPMWVIVIKALRIIRVFQLSEKIESMRTLVTSMRRSGPAIMNVGSLMVLSYIFFSVLGVFLFATVRPQWPLDHDIVNYQRVDNAFLILFRATSGENWHYVQYGMSREKSLKFKCDDNFSYEKYAKEGEPNQCGNVFLATSFFVIFHLFIGKAFVSLFIGVILQAYNEVLNSKEATINESHLLNYQRVWQKYDPIGRGFIKKEDLAKFLLDLRSPLGLEPEDWNGQELPFSYLQSLELSLYNTLTEYQFYNLLERLARKALIDDLIAQEIEKLDQDKNFDRKKIDAFLNKFETYSAQIKALEENKLNIHIVTEVQKVKNKYQGVGLIQIVTWREQQILTKLLKVATNKYLIRHGKAQNQKPDENTKKDEKNKQLIAKKTQYEANQSTKLLNQIDQSQELSKREQEQQLENLMDQIVKEESEKEEEYKEKRKLNQRANTNQQKKTGTNQKEQNIEVKNSSKTLLQGSKVSSDSKKMLILKGGPAKKQPKMKQEDMGSDQKSEMSRESDTMDQQKEEDIDFRSRGGRQTRESEEKQEKAEASPTKKVLPKGKRLTIDNNIDQLEAEVAAIIESEESEKQMLEDQILSELRGIAQLQSKLSRK